MRHYKDMNGEFHGIEDGQPVPNGYIEVTITDIEAANAAKIDHAVAVRAERDIRINAIVWRVERAAREQRMGLALTDDPAVLDTYVQALADVPQQPGFPTDYIDPASAAWPTVP